ncbi:CCA-adding enzyme-like [Salvia divinorum]|uniref:CCA-adding enzyme-like n=1 Tax=Salvia divinorum TaxID=28513 RepID=A0ABD1GXA4_SALDI
MSKGIFCIGEGEFWKWRKWDSGKLGLERRMISRASWIVLNNLRAKDGGCVRDLLLNKVPKDFDVITTAGLKQVKRMFRHALIIGKRFPICVVTVEGSVVEVSSVDTIAKGSGGTNAQVSQKPRGCDPRDFLLSQNCLKRDFTVNSLFFNPFANVIYDYTNGIMDLKSFKLRTIKPAHLSFKEDQARILRGFRLAARLNLSFSEEIENALYSLSSSVADLSTCRIFMEINYMLSNGAAERSLLMLKRFRLLDILLPFHAAYLSKQQMHNQLGVCSSILMLITCYQPCQGSLWVAILAFHLAICSNPQHPIVVLTFSSLLHHRTMEESIRFARQNALATRSDIPEIVGVPNNLVDDEIIERVSLLVEQVINSVLVLIKKECLLRSMTRFPESPSSGLVFIPKKMEQEVETIFDILGNGVKGNERSEEIRHDLLKKGDVSETRLVLGKIIATSVLQSKQGADHPTEQFALDKRNASATPSNYKKFSNRVRNGEVRGMTHTDQGQFSNPPKISIRGRGQGQWQERKVMNVKDMQKQLLKGNK